jgi:hypothetical protein
MEVSNFEVNKFRWEFGALTTSAFGKPVLPAVRTKGNIRSELPSYDTTGATTITAPFGKLLD